MSFLLVLLFCAPIYAAPDRNDHEGRDNHDSRSRGQGVCQASPWQSLRPCASQTEQHVTTSRQQYTYRHVPQPHAQLPPVPNANRRGGSRWAGQRADSQGQVQRPITSAPMVHLPHASTAPSVRHRLQNPSAPPRSTRRLAPPVARAPESGNPTARRIDNDGRQAVAANTWRQFLRERILTLGYRTAGTVWARSRLFQEGRFNESAIAEQQQYAGWCRDTILGFER